MRQLTKDSKSTNNRLKVGLPMVRLCSRSNKHHRLHLKITHITRADRLTSLHTRAKLTLERLRALKIHSNTKTCMANKPNRIPQPTVKQGTAAPQILLTLVTYFHFSTRTARPGYYIASDGNGKSSFLVNVFRRSNFSCRISTQCATTIISAIPITLIKFSSKDRLLTGSLTQNGLQFGEATPFPLKDTTVLPGSAPIFLRYSITLPLLGPNTLTSKRITGVPLSFCFCFPLGAQQRSVFHFRFLPPSALP